jgi:lipoprotein-anchoring transpeptidase ErfK/SrfK
MLERGGRRVRVAVAVLLLSAGAPTAIAVASAGAAVVSSAPVAAPRTAEQQSGGSSLESAAAKAGNTGRAVAMSLIGLAFAVAGTVLAFRRDFKEAATVFAVGIIAVLLATSAGVSLLRDTVTSLFGSH